MLLTNCFNNKNLIAEFKFVKNKIQGMLVSDTIETTCGWFPLCSKKWFKQLQDNRFSVCC